MKIWYTANATATGGRTGHVETVDGGLKLDLAVPQAMGGKATTPGTNPEELFGAGYAACFGSAMEHIARQKHITTGEIVVTAKVGIGPSDDGNGGFALAVELDVTVPALDQSAAEELVAAAHAVCPYSNATRGNIDVNLTAHGGA